MRGFPKIWLWVPGAALAAGSALVLCNGQLAAQNAASAADELKAVSLPEPSMYAQPLAEDRGAAQLEQTIKRLGTTASLLYIVAHPDDEDGALMTYLSRGMGARVTLLTLTRGEGGQNAMSAEENDAMGLIRTQELLKADEFYGVSQLWGTEVDFGFSKTQEEAFKNWGHERVLYDAVLAVRKVRPQIIVASFVGGVTDGHGQHQVSGEIAQEAFKAAADPSVFPDQLKDGLEPWQAMAVYSRAPFARVTQQGMFDYATGKWAQPKFHNYVSGEWTTGALSSDVTVPVGAWDPILGRTYVQIAREGWGEQKSQYGGASPALTGPQQGDYHLWGVAPEGQQTAGAIVAQNTLFDNVHVSIDTSVEGLARLAGGMPPTWLTDGLMQIQSGLSDFAKQCPDNCGVNGAKKLAPIYKQTLDLYARVKDSSLPAKPKADLEFELGEKIDDFQTAFKDLLGLDLIAFTTRQGEGQPGGGNRGGTADETSRSVIPGQNFRARVHVANAAGAAKLERSWLVSRSGSEWKSSGGLKEPSSAPVNDAAFQVQVAEDAQPTAPYFTRKTTEQPYYDVSNPAWRLRSFMPYPLEAWAEFSFEGVPIRIGGIVQTLQRVTGPGGIYEPLIVTPRVGVRVQPEARLLPLNGSSLPVHVTVQTVGAAEGTVSLKLPDGWTAQPSEAHFARKNEGETEPLEFQVKPANAGVGAYSIEAVAQSGGKSYEQGWHNVAYPGLLAYNQYEPAEVRTRKVDVKLASSLKIAYVMGTGDTVPEAIQELGVTPHLLTTQEVQTGDLSQWNTIVIGIRAYSNRPELTMAEGRLEDYVRRGGTLVVQYQSQTFPAPLPLSMGQTPERVVDETASVKLLDPNNPLLSWPNKITSADFNDWFEERGHSFLDSWDSGYTPLTESADPGQDPQRGGLIVAHPGKGTYIYVAFALHRQLPELVPGAYRLFANLLSAGHRSAPTIQSSKADRQ
jgi:LmbE family N-acetylglucosaminyl deacetylase